MENGGFEMTPTVLHVVTSLDYGGVETRMKLIAEYGNRDQFVHSFCAIAGGGNAARTLAEGGHQVHILGANPKIASVGAIFSITRVIWRLKPDVVHSHGGEANFHGTIAASLCFVKVRLAEEIGIPKHSQLARLVFRIVYRLASAVIGISDAVANSVEHLREVSRAKLCVIPNPFPVQPFHEFPANLEGESFHIAFVGRLEPVKNPGALINAIYLLGKKGIKVELKIVGGGSLHTQLLDLGTTLGLSPNVFFLGYLDAPFEVLQDSQLLVQPSITEGFGLAVVEAMSRGIPTLVSPHGAGPDLIENGKTGWILSSVDPEAIAEHIAEIIRLSHETRLHVASTASEFVRETFTVDKYLKRLHELYSILGPTARMPA